MATSLKFRYDREADVLYIDKCPPYREQESEELGEDIIARINPATGEVENLEVPFFSTRLLPSELFELPVEVLPFITQGLQALALFGLRAFFVATCTGAVCLVIIIIIAAGFSVTLALFQPTSVIIKITVEEFCLATVNQHEAVGDGA